MRAVLLSLSAIISLTLQRVQLYVYDLSRGMAKSMSLGLTGKQIDGIWYVL